MWKDPIVEELRSAAREIERKAGGDVHEFFELLRQDQEKYEERLVRSVSRSSETPSKL